MLGDEALGSPPLPFPVLSPAPLEPCPPPPPLKRERRVGPVRPRAGWRKAGVGGRALDEEGQWTRRLLLSPRILLAG